MPMQPSVLFDLGPYNVIPILDTTRFPIYLDRNLGYDTTKIVALESQSFLSTMAYIQPVHRFTARPPVDATGVYHNICGYMLMEEDPFGEPAFSGYNLVWQYHVDNSQTDWVRFNMRLIKINAENPLDMTVLASNVAGTGGVGGVSKVEVCICAVYAYYEEQMWMGVGVGGDMFNSSNIHIGVNFNVIATSEKFWNTSGYEIPDFEIDDPNEQDPEGPSRPGGGDGNHSRKTEAVTLPDLPDLGALDAGMITLYRLTGPEMTSFTSELWTFWSAIKAFFADPLDFVIGCMIVPFTPSSTRKAKPKFGLDVWNTAFDVISEQFYEISCGTIDIEKYYGSCFDYDPYHKLEIYIPYVGYRELPVDQVMGKTIELTYHIDCMTGDFVAFVHTPAVGAYGPQLAQIICQFAGTMGVHVPLSRESFDSMVSAGINLLGGAVGMAAGGIAQSAGLEGGGDLKANQIASQASSATVSAINSMKRTVIRSGSIGASSGMLAKQNPFIISTLPRQSLPENYKDLEGYPSNIYGTVGSFSGYLAVETIKLNVTATSTEKEMIMQLLKGGVFV